MERIKKIEKVDRKSVQEFAEKIKLDTIFFLEGSEKYARTYRTRNR